MANSRVVTPGAAGKVNHITGVVRIMQVTEEDWQNLAERELEANMLLRRVSDNSIYITEQGKKLKDLIPIVDTEHAALNDAAQTAIETAFSTGVYKAAAGGVVITDDTNKIDDEQLHVVEDVTDDYNTTTGVAEKRVAVDYLKEWIDPDTRIIRREKLPDFLRSHVLYVANIEARNNLPDNMRLDLVFVIDASDDPDVDVGSAAYVWFSKQDILDGKTHFVGLEPDDPSIEELDGKWIKIYENESLDINLDELKPTSESVEAAGAVMYDHMVMVESPSLADFITATDYVAPEPPAPTFTFSVAETDLIGNEGDKLALGTTFEGTATDKITVTVTPTNCSLSGFVSRGDVSDKPYVYAGDIKHLIAEFKNAKIVVGSTNGSVAISTDWTGEGDGSAKTINVTFSN